MAHVEFLQTLLEGLGSAQAFNSALSCRRDACQQKLFRTLKEVFASGRSGLQDDP